jgi:hypothetical protein
MCDGVESDQGLFLSDGSQLACRAGAQELEQVTLRQARALRYNMHSLPPAESRPRWPVSTAHKIPKTHQRCSLSHGRDIGSGHATFASQEGQICKPKMSQFDAIRGDACAGMFSRMGKMRRPRVTRSISRYRVAEAGKLAVSKCKLRIFKMHHLGDEPLACTALDHCQRRAAGEPADEAGEARLIEFAANDGQSLDWIMLGDLDPTLRRPSATGHDDGDPAVMVA